MFGKPNQHKGFKLGHRERTVLMEALEDRALLSVNPLGCEADMVPAIFAEYSPAAAAQDVSADAVAATQLTVPGLETEVKNSSTVLVKIAEVENASGYNLQYSIDEEFTDPTTVSVSAGQTSLGGLDANTTYYFRAQATGDGVNYSDSEFGETVSATTEKIQSPNIQITDKSIKVSWKDDSDVADSIRYRVKDTMKWTTKKLKDGVTEYTFNGKYDTTYEIEVFLDQNKTNVLQGTATVLAKPKLTVLKETIKDTTFQVEVSNFNTTNLAENTMIAIVTINDEDQYVFLQDDDDEEQGEGGNESFADTRDSSSITVEFSKKTGIFTISGLESNTSYKVSVSFMSLEFNFSTGSDSSSNTGIKIVSSPTSNTVRVKTIVTPYAPPTNVQAKATSDTAIAVTWESSDAPKYTVEYSTDGKTWKKATTKAEGTAYTIEKLKGGTEYQVRVSATKDKQYSASDPCYGESVTTLPTPKVTLDKNSVTSTGFTLNVETIGFAEVIYVQSSTFDEVTIYLSDNGTGSAIINAGTGFKVSYADGALTFTNAPANTQQKVQISLSTSDGVSTTAWSKAVSVKTKAEEMV